MSNRGVWFDGGDGKTLFAPRITYEAFYRRTARLREHLAYVNWFGENFAVNYDIARAWASPEAAD